MANPKLDELATDIDDASTVVEELEVDRDDADEKLHDLRKTLERAADMIDEIGGKDENGKRIGALCFLPGQPAEQTVINVQRRASEAMASTYYIHIGRSHG